MTPNRLAAPDWRLRMLDRKPVATHALALSLMDAGYAGLITPSFAPSAEPGCRNLILSDLDHPKLQLRVSDEENRLK